MYVMISDERSVCINISNIVGGVTSSDLCPHVASLAPDDALLCHHQRPELLRPPSPRIRTPNSPLRQQQRRCLQVRLVIRSNSYYNYLWIVPINVDSSQLYSIQIQAPQIASCLPQSSCSRVSVVRLLMKNARLTHRR